MIEWMKKHKSGLIATVVSAGFLFYGFACTPTVQSLVDETKRVNRAELQLELEHMIALAKIRMLDIEQQEKLRAVILQNALMLGRGDPFNPLGLLTGLASIYGVAQASSNVTRAVKTARDKKRNIDGQRHT